MINKMKDRSALPIVILIFSLLLSACVSQNNGGKDGDFDPVTAAKTRISLGLTYLKNGNYTQAKVNLDKALDYAPRLADTHYSIAYYYQVVGENERANQAYQKALDLAPNNADIANTFGAFLCQQGQYEKSKRYFLKAVNNNNYASAAETYENLALCSQSQSKSDEAIEYLQTAVKHQPNRTKSLYLLAELQSAKKEWSAAQQSLKSYVKVASVSAESLALAMKIERGLGNVQIADGYGQMLVKMFPKHPITRNYLTRLKHRNVLAKSALTASDKAQSDVELVKTIKAAEADVKPVPNSDSQPEKATKPAAVVTEAVQTASVESKLDDLTHTQPRYHLVKKQENLYRISLQYNVKMARLIEWNNLPEDGAIQVGMKLIVTNPEHY